MAKGYIGACGSIVFVLCDDRADFDKIDLPEVDHGPKDCGHCLSKMVEGGGCTVFFQHWVPMDGKG